jgi:hypothetical protein
MPVRGNQRSTKTPRTTLVGASPPSLPDESPKAVPSRVNQKTTKSPTTTTDLVDVTPQSFSQNGVATESGDVNPVICGFMRAGAGLVEVHQFIAYVGMLDIPLGKMLQFTERQF